MPRRKRKGGGGGIHHRDAEDTKLRKDREIWGSDLGNPLDGLAVPLNHFHGLARLKISTQEPKRI